jgi:hypothetical protein
MSVFSTAALRRCRTISTGILCDKASNVLDIPAHCNVQGNEKADKLAKEGCKILDQTDVTISYEEAKCTIKAHTRRHGRKTTRTMTTPQLSSTDKGRASYHLQTPKRAQQAAAPLVIPQVPNR